MSQSPSTPTPLEELPFEIQRLILSQAPTFDTLRALVHASPRLHSVYVQDRLPILRDFIEQAFDGFLVHAHAASLSGTDEFQRSRTESMLWGFVATYRQQLANSDSTAAKLSLEDIIQLVRFHQSVIELLTDRYAAWALAALSSSPTSDPLSGTERRRIQRGLYNLQVFCNLCGSRGGDAAYQSSSETPSIASVSFACCQPGRLRRSYVSTRLRGTCTVPLSIR